MLNRWRYPILETAKANGLRIDKYLEYIMDKLSNIEEDINQDNLLKTLMPWSSELPKHIYIQIPEQES